MSRAKMPLPPFQSDGPLSLESVLLRRRSVREYLDSPLSLSQAAQILWATQGLTGVENHRTAPSAGALYPLETYLVAGRIEMLPPGIYRYVTADHSLSAVCAGDRRRRLAEDSLRQTWISQAPAAIVLTAVESRSARKYGRRASRYVMIEAGCAAQNASLQAIALDLGSVVIGAFDDEALLATLELPAEERPVLMLTVGYPKT
jgi:SagB-type dehydrogenase family enzyme